METIILMIHILSSLALIGFILIQHGKGAEVGANFGGGASQTVFGSQGSGSFLTRTTAILVTIFFLTNLGLGHYGGLRVKSNSIDQLIDKVQSQETSSGSSKDSSKPVIEKESEIPN